MRYTECTFNFIPQENGYDGMYKMMERAARQCYKTESSIKDGSAFKIIDEVIIPSGHTSILEFGTVYLQIPLFRIKTWLKYLKDRYSRIRISGRCVYVTTTYRSILQGDYKDPVDAIKNKFDKCWMGDFIYWVDPTEKHHKRYTYQFVMDRAGSQSVERHRGRYGISYAQESTRFINYNRDKFSHEITCCYPSKFYDLVEKYGLDLNDLDGCLAYLRENDEGWRIYENSIKQGESAYMNLVESHRWRPEEARGLLPLDVKTEFMMCAYEEDWKMFLFRRTEKHAHPQIQRITNELFADMKARGLKIDF